MVFAVVISAFIFCQNIPGVFGNSQFHTHIVLSVCVFHCGPVTTHPDHSMTTQEFSQ